METARTITNFLSNLIWSQPDFFPFMIFLLLFTGSLATIKTRFVQFRLFFHSWKVMFGKYDDPNDVGDISHFQAISAVLSATVGIGNIAGVATAIHYGGPGALFWMWVTAILGMALKFSETLLAVKYRVKNPDGSVSGGPMYSIERGMGSKFKWMAILFAAMLVIASFGIGNTIQAFTVADQFQSDWHIPTWITGLFLATVVGAVILGGIKRIGKVTSFLSPFMCISYVLGGLTVIALNYRQLPASFALIFKSAFSPAAGVGGFAGSTFLFMTMWGIKRGLFSNEAGQGSAPIGHSAAKTNEPAREAANSMLGPFIDTLVVCTITGLVIVITGVWNQKKPDLVIANAQSTIWVVPEGSGITTNAKLEGRILTDTTFLAADGIVPGIAFIKNHALVDSAQLFLYGKPFTGMVIVDKAGLMKPEPGIGQFYLKGNIMQNGSPLTAWAFQTGLQKYGNWGGLIVTIGVFLFAISTAISWSYYGDRGAQYLFGQKAVFWYRCLYVIAHFIGATVSLEVEWAFGDFANGLMAIPNLICVIALSNVVKQVTKKYTSMKQLTYKEQLTLKTKGK